MKHLPNSRNKTVQMTGGLNWLLAGLLGVLVCAIVILASVPPVSRDALSHHLAVPKLYLEQGGMHEIPSLKFSYYPMNVDLLYLIPLYFGNDIIPKYIHFSFALLTAWLIFVFLNKRLDRIYALIGVVFFLSLPIIVRLSIAAYVDLGLIFFSTVSLVCLLKWLETGYRLRFLVLAAVACGLCLGTKYNGLIAFFLISVFIPWLFVRSAQREKDCSHRSTYHFVREGAARRGNLLLRTCGYCLLFASISLAVFSPWMIRNYRWTGNPIYPLYNGWFHAKTAALSESSFALGHFGIRRIVFGESWGEIALIPLRIFFEGRDDLPQKFDGVLNPLLLILPVLGFVGFRKNNAVLNREMAVLGTFALLFVLFAFLKTDMRIRYIAPVIPPLIILAAFGLQRCRILLQQFFKNRARWLVTACWLSILAAALGPNAGYLMKQYRHVDPFSYLSGRLTRDDYIKRYRPEYPLIQWSNRNLSQDAVILCLFLGNRRYYSDRDMRFADGYFQEVVKNAESSGEISAGLKQGGITHILIRFDLFNFTFSKQISDRQKQILQDFVKEHLTSLATGSGYGLYRLH